MKRIGRGGAATSPAQFIETATESNGDGIPQRRPIAARDGPAAISRLVQSRVCRVVTHLRCSRTSPRKRRQRPGGESIVRRADGRAAKGTPLVPAETGHTKRCVPAAQFRGNVIALRWWD